MTFILSFLLCSGVSFFILVSKNNNFLENRAKNTHLQFIFNLKSIFMCDFGYRKSRIVCQIFAFRASFSYYSGSIMNTRHYAGIF